MASRKSADRGPRPPNNGPKPPDRGPKPPQSPDAKAGSNPDNKPPVEAGSILGLTGQAIEAVKKLLGPSTENLDITLAELKSTQLDLATLEKFRDQFKNLQKHAQRALEILRNDLSAIVLDEDMKKLLGGTPESSESQALEKAVTEVGKFIIGLDLRIETKIAEEENQRESEKDKKKRQEFATGLKMSETKPGDLLMALNAIDRSTVTEFLIKKSTEKEFSETVKKSLEEANRFYEEDLASVQKDRDKYYKTFVPSEQLAQWQEILQNPVKVEELKKRGAYEKALDKVATQYETEFQPFRMAKEAEFAGFEEAARYQRDEEIARAVSEEISIDDVGEILKTPDFHLAAVADNLAEIYFNTKDKKDILSARMSLYTPSEVTEALLGKFSNRSIETIETLKLGVFYTEAFGHEVDKRGLASPNEAQNKAVRKNIAEKAKIVQQKFIDAKTDAVEINTRAKLLQEGKKVAEGQEGSESLQKIQADFEKTSDIIQLEALLNRVNVFEIQVQQVNFQLDQKVTELKDLLSGMPPIAEVGQVFLEDIENYKNSLHDSTPLIPQLISAVAELKQRIDAKLIPLRDAVKARDKAQREQQVGSMFEVQQRFQNVQFELHSLETDLHSIETRIHHNKEVLARIAEARSFNLEADISLFHGAELHEITVGNILRVDIDGTRNKRREIFQRMLEVEKTVKNEIKKLEAQIEPRKEKFEHILAPLSGELQSMVKQLEKKGMTPQDIASFQTNAEVLINQFKGKLHEIHSHEKSEITALHKKLKLMAEISKGGKDKVQKQEELRKLQRSENPDTARLDQADVVDFQNSTDAKRKSRLEELESHIHHLQAAIDRLHFTPLTPGTVVPDIGSVTPTQTDEDRNRVGIEQRRLDLQKDFNENLEHTQSEVKKFEALGNKTKEELENYRRVLKDIETVRKYNVMAEIPVFGTAPLKEATVDEGIVVHKKGTKEMRRALASQMESLAKDMKQRLGKNGIANHFEQEQIRIQESVNRLSRELVRVTTYMESVGIQKAEYQRFLNDSIIQINRLKARVAQVGIKEIEVKAPKPAGGHH